MTLDYNVETHTKKENKTMNLNVETIVSKRTMSLMIASVLLLAGVLFCISPAIGESSAGIVIGIGVILLGLILGVKDFLTEKSLISRGVIVGSMVVALGVYCTADGSIVSKVIGVIPYILIVTGACITADAVLLKTVRKTDDNKKFGIELSIGIGCIVLGSLILALSFFRKALAVIIGIILIIGSVYYLLQMFKLLPAKKKANAENAGEGTDPAESAEPVKTGKKQSTKKTK